MDFRVTSKQKIPDTLFLQGDFNLILYYQAYRQTFSTVSLNGMQSMWNSMPALVKSPALSLRAGLYWLGLCHFPGTVQSVFHLRPDHLILPNTL